MQRKGNINICDLYGLTVRATLLEGTYAKGQKVSDTEMEHLNIEHAEMRGLAIQLSKNLLFFGFQSGPIQLNRVSLPMSSALHGTRNLA